MTVHDFVAQVLNAPRTTRCSRCTQEISFPAAGCMRCGLLATGVLADVLPEVTACRVQRAALESAQAVIVLKSFLDSLGNNGDGDEIDNIRHQVHKPLHEVLDRALLKMIGG
jgi:hypothetical protein